MLGKRPHSQFIWPIVVLALLAIYGTAAAQEDNVWLPLQRADIVRLLGEAQAENTRIQTVDEWISDARSNSKVTEKGNENLQAEKQRLNNFLASDETLSVISSQTGPLSIFVLGSGDRVHSLRMTLPVVNYSRTDSDRILKFLSLLLKATYPSWPQAPEWPTESLKQVWDLKRIRAGGNAIVLHRQDGITVATFGVPPDIVAYTITARERCVPTVQQTGHFRRFIC